MVQQSQPLPSPGCSAKIYVALHDYEEKNSDDLSFKKGQLLEIIHDEDWWYAKSPTTQKEGYIPSNYVTTPVMLDSQGSGYR